MKYSLSHEFIVLSQRQQQNRQDLINAAKIVEDMITEAGMIGTTIQLPDPQIKHTYLLGQRHGAMRLEMGSPRDDHNSSRNFLYTRGEIVNASTLLPNPEDSQLGYFARDLENGLLPKLHDRLIFLMQENHEKNFSGATRAMAAVRKYTR